VESKKKQKNASRYFQKFGNVHLLVMIPSKISVSNYVGAVKGGTAIRILN
jgi:hypothetical protein